LNITVAVLIGLFLLMLFPPMFELLIYPGQHESARLASCQSNMKQLGLAMEQYTQDSNGVLPPSTARNGMGWREAIYPFVKSTDVYRCPRYRQSGDYSPDNLPRSYAANHLGPDSQRQERGAFALAGEPPVMLTQFKQPGETITLCDTQASNASEWNMGSQTFLSGAGRQLYIHHPGHPFYERPVGTLNCLFTDGHVKRLKPTATLAPINLWTRNNAPFMGHDLQNARAILKHAEDE